MFNEMLIAWRYAKLNKIRFISSVHNDSNCGSCMTCFTTRRAIEAWLCSGCSFSFKISPYWEYDGWQFLYLLFRNNKPLQNSISALMSLTALNATVIICVASRMMWQSLLSKIGSHILRCGLLLLHRLLQNQTSMQFGQWILIFGSSPHPKQPEPVQIKYSILANADVAITTCSASISWFVTMCFGNTVSRISCSFSE